MLKLICAFNNKPSSKYHLSFTYIFNKSENNTIKRVNVHIGSHIGKIL